MADAAPQRNVITRVSCASTQDIVRDEALYPVVEQRLRQCCDELGLVVVAWFDSPITGGDGNREFFIQAVRPPGQNL